MAEVMAVDIMLAEISITQIMDPDQIEVVIMEMEGLISELDLLQAHPQEVIMEQDQTIIQ
jgi:hypothetical protein